MVILSRLESNTQNNKKWLSYGTLDIISRTFGYRFMITTEWLRFLVIKYVKALSCEGAWETAHAAFPFLNPVLEDLLGASFIHCVDNQPSAVAAAADAAAAADDDDADVRRGWISACSCDVVD